MKRLELLARAAAGKSREIRFAPSAAVGLLLGAAAEGPGLVMSGRFEVVLGVLVEPGGSEGSWEEVRYGQNAWKKEYAVERGWEREEGGREALRQWGSAEVVGDRLVVP